jgi:hypothetical protein
VGQRLLYDFRSTDKRAAYHTPWMADPLADHEFVEFLVS